MNRSLKTTIVSLSCLITIAVSSVAQTASQQPEAAKPPRYGGVLEIALTAKPAHLNSAIASGIFTGTPATQIFASLLRLSQTWEYQPYLADKWEVAQDGLSVTFHLRSNATFHDGKPVTSEDVAFSLLTIQTYHPFPGMLAALEKVDTPDPLTVVVRLKKPHPALLTVLASPMAPILPKHVYGDGRDIKTHPANLAPVGSGPFKFTSFIDNEIVLEKYFDFFLPGRPYLDKLVFKAMKPSVIPIAFETGSVQLQGFSPAAELSNAYGKPENLGIEHKGYQGIGGICWLAFNMRKPPLNDAHVRRAIAYAIDRDFLTKNIFGDNGIPATGPINPGSPFYSDNVNKYPENTDLANRLLDEAGYPRNDKGIRFTLTLASMPPIFVGLGDYIQSALSRKLGIKVKRLTFNKFSEWSKLVANGDFELAVDLVFNWGDPVIGVHRTYSSRNIRPGVIWSNTQGYSNPVVDELMDKAGVEMNVDRRKALYAEFQEQVVEDLPVYWIYEVPYTTVYRQRLMGVTKSSVWGLMFPFTDVYWSHEK